MDNLEKINIENVDWKSSREFFESLGETLDKLDNKDESYDFTWVGKRKSIIEAGAPISKTLRPDIDASKDFNNTKNMLIVGDNLDALKILQESYLGKIKTIYIDPPYNTGHDFVYHDNFSVKKGEYSDDSTDTDGNRIVSEDEFIANSKSNGRFHSDWLSMMYPRLRLARNLLSDDGLIFISIDDNEDYNLQKLCNEIFGEDNFVNKIVWYYGKMSNESNKLANNHEYVLVYKKTDAGGIYKKVKKEDSEYRNRYLRFVTPENTVKYGDVKNSTDNLIIGRVKKVKAELKKDELDDDDVLFDFNKEFKPHSDTIYHSIIKGNAEENVKEFDMGQKPLGLIELYLELSTDPGDIVLDFFAGSGTTGHAVMDLNAKDNGDRKFICVQINEKTDDKSEAAKSGYDSIDMITANRLRKFGDIISRENPDKDLDVGFRVFRIDSGNENDDIRKPLNEIHQSNIFEMVDNIKKDRTPLDLLFGVVYASALPFDLDLDIRKIGDNTVYLYGYLDESSGLVACFDDEITEDTIKEIAKLKPLTAVFKDTSFKESADKINLSEHFRIISPETKVKVL